MAGANLANRKLSDQLRWKLLKEANDIMDGDDKLAKKELLMKMANTILPRLNEHTGEGGGDIKVNIVKYGDTITLPIQSKTISNTLPSSDGQRDTKSDTSLE